MTSYLLVRVLYVQIGIAFVLQTGERGMNLLRFITARQQGPRSTSQPLCVLFESV
jgi:hypothetical protein